MADAPKLNSATDATAARYAPLSGLAVLALVIGVVFVAVLAVFGWLAYQNGQPLLEGLLFLFPVAGVLVAFVARRQIRNAEGARTGEGYAAAGWWVCVVGGACYLAYWAATEWSVRADAEQSMTQWADKFRRGDPNDPNDPAVREAFLKMLEPLEAAELSANPRRLQAPQYGLKLAQFRDSPLLLISHRNPDAALAPQGLRKWEISPDGKITCEVAAVLRCGEGEFPVTVPMRGVTDGTTKKRAWQVYGGQRYLDPQQSLRTRYGWLLDAIDWQAREVVQRAIICLRSPSYLAEDTAAGQVATVAGYVSGRGAEFTDALRTTEPDRTALAGGLGLFFAPTSPGDAFFTRSGGGPLTDAEFVRADGGKVANGRATLREVWGRADVVNLAPAWLAGNTPAEAVVQYTLIEPSATQVLFKVPVEFKPRTTEYQGTNKFTAGRLVVVCDDPAVLKELADAKAAGDRPTRDRPTDLRDRRFPLRLLRLESDLTPVETPKPPSSEGDGPGGPGGPGGPPARPCG